LPEVESVVAFGIPIAIVLTIIVEYVVKPFLNSTRYVAPFTVLCGVAICLGYGLTEGGWSLIESAFNGIYLAGASITTYSVTRAIAPKEKAG
jgi:hypothetical protein